MKKVNTYYKTNLKNLDLTFQPRGSSFKFRVDRLQELLIPFIQSKNRVNKPQNHDSCHVTSCDRGTFVALKLNLWKSQAQIMTAREGFHANYGKLKSNCRILRLRHLYCFSKPSSRNKNLGLRIATFLQTEMSSLQINESPVMLIRTFKEYLTLVNFYCNFILKSN